MLEKITINVYSNLHRDLYQQFFFQRVLLILGMRGGNIIYAMLKLESVGRLVYCCVKVDGQVWNL